MRLPIIAAVAAAVTLGAVLPAAAATCYPRVKVTNETSKTLYFKEAQVSLKGRPWSYFSQEEIDEKEIKPGKSRVIKHPLVTGGYKGDRIRLKIAYSKKSSFQASSADKIKTEKFKCSKRYKLSVTELPRK